MSKLRKSARFSSEEFQLHQLREKERTGRDSLGHLNLEDPDAIYHEAVEGYRKMDPAGQISFRLSLKYSGFSEEEIARASQGSMSQDEFRALTEKYHPNLTPEDIQPAAALEHPLKYDSEKE